MRELLLFPHAAVYTRDLLRTLLADRPERYAREATVSTKPTTGDDTTRPRPYIHVGSDGGTVIRGIRSVDRQRINVNAADEGHAYNLAELVRGLLVPDTAEPLATVLLDAVVQPLKGTP
jgi:hypothetical protein